MPTNTQKTPLGLSLNRFAKKRALDQIAKTGTSLPCTVVSVTGAIVEVSFEVTAVPHDAPVTIPNVTMPIQGWEYIRIPVQVGDKGYAVPADASLAGVSGLGAGTATLTQPSNLGALAFHPLGNKGWAPTDPNSVDVNGPNGVILRDAASACTLVLTPEGISITIPSGHNMTWTVSGGGQLNISGGNVVLTGGDVMADGVSLKTHVHSGVQTGGGDTGPPV